MVFKSEGHGGKPMGMSDGEHLNEVGGMKYENPNHIGVGEVAIGDGEEDELKRQLEESGLEGAWHTETRNKGEGGDDAERAQAAK